VRIKIIKKEINSLYLWRMKVFFFEVLNFCFTVALPGAKETEVSGLMVNY